MTTGPDHQGIPGEPGQTCEHRTPEQPVLDPMTSPPPSDLSTSQRQSAANSDSAGLTDQHERALIDRLASTTTSLRNLFYINLVLAAAILYLVMNDPGFVSQRIGPALQTLEPIFKVYAYVKDNADEFKEYRQQLRGILNLARDTIDGEQRKYDNQTNAEKDTLKEAARHAFSKDEMDFLDSLLRERGSEPFFTKAHQLLDSAIEKDHKTIDYQSVFFEAGFLYPQFWVPFADKFRSLIVKVDALIPGTQPPGLKEFSTANLSLLNFGEYNDAQIHDPTLGSYLDALPEPIGLFEAGEIIDAFCRANVLGICSIQDIEKWRASQDAGSPGKLETSWVTVNVTRGVIVPAAPIILLIAQHAFIVLYRRRAALRQCLGANLSQSMLNFFDELWIPYEGHSGSPDLFWRHAQSILILCFIIIGELMPLISTMGVSYYIYNQVLFTAVTAKDFAEAIADFKEFADTIGVTGLPLNPEVPRVLSEYVYFGVSLICGVFLLVSLLQLIRDQFRETR
jgi:hypothetical protein